MPGETVVPFDYLRRLDRREEAPRTVDPVTETLGAMHAEDVHQTILDNPQPDKVARVSRLSRETGDAPFHIYGNEDAIETAQRAAKFSALVSRSSALGRWAVQNPRGAAAAQDDHDSLSLLSNAWEGLKNVGYRLGAGTAESVGGLLEGGGPIEWLTDPVVTAFGGQSLAERNRKRAAEYRSSAAGLRELGRADNWWADQALSGLEFVPITVAAALTRNPAIATAIPALSVRGSSLAEARRQGMSGASAEVYADIQGGVEYATERLPMGTLVDMIARKVPFAKAFVREMGQELATEQVATVLQDMADWAFLPENKDKSFQDYIDARPEAFMATAVATASGTAVHTVLAQSAGRAADASVRVADRTMQASRARAERAVIDRMERAAAGSKLRQRDPEAFREMLRQQAEEAGATRVFIPAEAVQTYHQSDSYDSNEDPFASFDIAESSAAGGDIVMPIEDALTDLVGTKAWAAVKDDVRLTAGGMSAREAEQFNERMDDLMAELSDEAAQRDAADRKERTAREKIVDQVAEMFGVSFTSPAARNIAELFAQRAQTRAARLGQELTGDETAGFAVRQIMPEGVAEAVKADNLDLVINAMRQGKDAGIPQGPSLLEFIKRRGGINDSGGDLKAMGVPAKYLRDHDPRQTTMGISGQGDFGHDTVLRAAIEAGYFPELAQVENEAGPSTLDTQALLDALAEEVAGRPRYAEVRDDPVRRAAEDLRATLEESGLSPDGMSDAEVKAAVERMITEGAEGALRQSDMSDQVRGQFSFDENKRIIELFQSRNLSTPLHELSHMWLEELRFDAVQPDAPEQLKADWETAKRYFAANGHTIGEDGQIPTEAHELWARSGERYLMEGKAPSSALTRLFETFRAWLVNIYKTVDRLRAPITPEIREVFDRLIATDEEIETVRERQHIEALFHAAADIGMSDDEFTAYQRQVDDAKAGAHAALLDKTMRAIRRRETERYNEARRKVRADEQERIDASPLYRAVAGMKESRVSREWIVGEMGEDALGLLPVRVPPLYVSGGVHPDVIAEQSGYASGREMLEATIGAERAHRQEKEGGDTRSMRERAIENATDEEMNRRYGDPLNDGSIEREALAAVHSEMHGEVIASELRILSRKTGQRPTPYRIAREWARGKVRGGTVAQEASPSALQRYARNAAKAGREAQAAMLKQDVEETFRQKQAQMLNNGLLSEAKAAADEVAAAVKRMDKIARARTRKSIDQDYLEQAQALLEAVDLRPRSQLSIDRQGQWAEWAAAREAEGYDVVVPASFEATINRTHWSRLSVENLLSLDEAVKQIVHLGRLKQTLIDRQDEREWAEITAEAAEGAGNLNGPPPPGLDDPNWGEALRARVAGADAGLLKMETLFDWLDGGNPEGVFNRIAFRPVADAQAREQDMLKDYYARIKALFEAVPGEQLARWSDKVALPLEFRGELISLTRQKLVAMALNVGNEGNLQRLTDGYGWNAAEVEALLGNTLTAEEWQFVQGVWDTIDTLWPEIEAMERRVNGIAPEKVEARAVVTAHGSFRGGYYPAIYDSRLDERAEINAGRETDLFETTYTRATTRASATKDRAEKVRRPILLDLGVINRHLGEVIHDVTHREAVMQAHRFLTDSRVTAAVDAALGQEYRRQFRPWVKFVANSWAMERAGNEGFGKWIGKLRANATAVGLGLRATTMVTQLAGYSNSVEVVGEEWIAKGIAQTTAHPVATFKFVMERSGEVRHRMDTLDRDLRTELARLAAKNPVSKGLTRLDEAKAFMFHGIGLMDRTVVIPTWMGAYNKALAGGLDEAAAAFAADKAVRVSQGAGAPKDLAAIQRGTGRWGEALKLFTMFYSYFSAEYQRERTLGRDVAGRDARKPRNMPRLAARAFWLLVVPPLLVEVLKMPLGAGGPDDDEWWLQWAARKLLANALGPIPLARDVFEPAWQSAIKGKFFNPSISPVQRLYDSIIKSAGDTGKLARGDETKHATKDFLETAGYVTGLVPGQIAASAQFLVDVGQGDADPQSFSDWLEGLSRGKIED